MCKVETVGKLSGNEVMMISTFELVSPFRGQKDCTFVYTPFRVKEAPYT